MAWWSRPVTPTTSALSSAAPRASTTTCSAGSAAASDSAPAAIEAGDAARCRSGREGAPDPRPLRCGRDVAVQAEAARKGPSMSTAVAFARPAGSVAASSPEPHSRSIRASVAGSSVRRIRSVRWVRKTTTRTERSGRPMSGQIGAECDTRTHGRAGGQAELVVQVRDPVATSSHHSGPRPTPGGRPRRRSAVVRGSGRPRRPSPPVRLVDDSA